MTELAPKGKDHSPGDPAPWLVDRRVAAKLLNVSPGTIDNLRISCKLRSLKVRERRLFDVADIRRFIEAQKGVA